LAEVKYTQNAKLMLTRYSNYVDPDNYGFNHGYMAYWDGDTDLEMQDISRRDSNQRTLFYNFLNIEI
jgi:hypothetical protein